MNDYLLLIIIALVAANIISFVLVGVDKKKSFNPQARRFPEVCFYVWSVPFASLGTFLGFFIFRHKTRKFYMPLGMVILTIEQVALLYLLWLQISGK